MDLINSIFLKKKGKRSEMSMKANGVDFHEFIRRDGFTFGDAVILGKVKDRENMIVDGRVGEKGKIEWRK